MGRQTLFGGFENPNPETPMRLSNDREPRHYRQPAAPQVPIATLVHETKIDKMLRQGGYVRVADYCLRRDHRASREQILAAINGLCAGSSWHLTHSARIANLVKRGAELKALDADRDAELYRELKANGVHIPCISPTST